MKKWIVALSCIAILLCSLTACSSPGSSNDSSSLPLMVVENGNYELTLIDVYQSDEQYVEDTEEDNTKPCYVFKFALYNKHENSNIRVSLTRAAVNGYSLAGAPNVRSDDSFSVYTWCGDGADNTAVGCFKLFFNDIEKATDIRDAQKMGNASLSFDFKVFIIEEMEDYGEPITVTIENAFQYCS